MKVFSFLEYACGKEKEQLRCSREGLDVYGGLV